MYTIYTTRSLAIRIWYKHELVDFLAVFPFTAIEIDILFIHNSEIVMSELFSKGLQKNLVCRSWTLGLEFSTSFCDTVGESSDLCFHVNVVKLGRIIEYATRIRRMSFHRNLVCKLKYSEYRKGSYEHLTIPAFLYKSTRIFYIVLTNPL